MKRTIAIFGATGGLGSQIVPLMKPEFNVIELSSNTFDIRDFEAVKSFFNLNKVDIV